MSDGNGWIEWRRYVLKGLETNDEAHHLLIEKIDSLSVDISIIRRDIAILQLKAGLWGLLGGTFVTIGVLLIGLLK